MSIHRGLICAVTMLVVAASAQAQQPSCSGEKAHQFDFWIGEWKVMAGEKIAAKIGLPPEKAICEGCRPQGGAIACLGRTEPCNAYRCAEEKGVDFCCDCDDFPCDHLHPYADKAAQVPHNTKVFNLCLIKKMGLEKWAAEKAAEVKATYFKGKWKI